MSSRRSAVALLTVLGAAAPLRAQPQTQGDITYTLTGAVAHQNGASWSNAPTIVPASNWVAFSGPNQGVLFRITMSMSIPSRAVDFSLLSGSLGLGSWVAAMDSSYAYGYTLPVSLRVQTIFGPGITIQVVPAPWSGALGIGLAIAAGRRRRRREKVGDCP